MIVTKITGLVSAGALAYSAAASDGVFGLTVALAIVAPFIIFAEYRPARRWIMTQMGKRTDNDRYP